jgi:PrtD family type I secretion system ABC transporter
VTGAGIHALFDLPWAPIYIAVIFLLHPLLGLFALAAASVLVLAALINEWLIRRPLEEANEAAARNYSFTEMSLRNAEVIHAMGMVEGLIRRWARDRTLVFERQTAASDRAAAMASLIRFLRLSMQSIILGLGAYLVIERISTVGTMFAASILLGRALQPVELIVGAWRGLVSGRVAFLRVKALLTAHPPHARSLVLPRPAGRLSVEGLQYAIAGASRPILKGLNFRVGAGEALGVIGPSGAGKSTLARLVVGVLGPSTGAVRLDGADVSIWQRESLGRHVGYLPQDVELFADTVAANISRFQSHADAEIVQAARLAGVHDMILHLADGYETEVGEAGAVLSGGYRQRVGLARAVFGDPALVVLDEPSSNLDADGDAALAECVLELKKRGTTVIIVSHRPSTLSTVDKVLVLREGAMEMFGERAEIIARLTRPVRVQPVPADAGAVAAAGG